MRLTTRAVPYSACIFFALLLPINLASVAQGVTPVAPAMDALATSRYSIDYTGALFGYYRIDPSGAVPEPAIVRMFLEQRANDPGRLLLGTGDNFGPEFGAAIQPVTLQPATSRGPCTALPLNKSTTDQYKNAADWLPQGVYKDESRYPGVQAGHPAESDQWPAEVECDNVGLFLLAARYAALVPGREDFLYSATWLRGMALGFRHSDTARMNSVLGPLKLPEIQLGSAYNDDGAPLMLAANLRVKWTAEGQVDAAKKLKSTCSLLFADKILDLNGANCTDGVASETTAMDWLDRLDATINDNAEKGKTKDTDVARSIQQGTSQASAESDKAHADSVQQRRVTLVENQAAIMQSMLLGVTATKDSPVQTTVDNITAALKVLSPKPNSGGLDPLGIQLEWSNKSSCDATEDLLRELKPQLKNAAKDGDGSSAQVTAKADPILGHKAACLLRDEMALNCAPDHHPTDPNTQLPADLCRYGRDLAAKLLTFRSASELHQMEESKDTGVAQAEDLLGTSDFRDAARRMLLRGIAIEQAGIGYKIARPADGQKTLLIGVVGPETLAAVSPMNLRLCTGKLERNAAPEQIELCGADRNGFDAGYGRLVGTVTTFDPLRTLTAVIRGATVDETFDRIVVMAQMPHTEAEELGAHLRQSLRKTGDDRAPILMLTEAQQEHATPNLQESFNWHEMTPVLTPHPAYNTESEQMVKPVSTLRSYPACEGCLRRHGEASPVTDELENEADAPVVDPTPATKTMLGLLLVELQNAGVPAGVMSGLMAPDTHCVIVPGEKEDPCKVAMTEFLLKRLQISSHADAVMLEYRDLFYAHLADDYAGYETCTGYIVAGQQLTDEEQKKCRLRVALDRVLWKGDSSERVMVAGKDLAGMLNTAQQQYLLQDSLAARDVDGQWLTSFGIVEPVSSNLTQLTAQNDVFEVPQDRACNAVKDPSTQATAYCVNGLPIAQDAAYWVTTSDHIANDAVLYKVLQASQKDYHQQKHLYITEEIANSLLPVQQTATSSGHTIRPALRTAVLGDRAEWNHQQRPLFHIDISKLVAGFTAREPEGGNSYVATNFQGATDSRASAASQQELDLESLTRFSMDMPIPTGWLLAPKVGESTQGNAKSNRYVAAPVSLGVQTDSEFDRQLTGNLSNKPENGVYALNSVTVGGFVQVRVPHFNFLPKRFPYSYGRGLPRALVVLTPHQYQQQITGNFLFIPYSAAGSTNELTVHAPTVTSFFDKVGMRFEYQGSRPWQLDKGSYVEMGYEVGVQNNVLQKITLMSHGTTVTCGANIATPIPTCFKNTTGFTVDATTTGLPVTTTTLHQMGAYWDFHLQKGWGKTGDKSGPGVNFTVDSRGDWYSPRGAVNGHALSTQPQFAYPVAFALNFPVLRNFSFSPTYTLFHYASQVTGQRLVENTVSISAKWYFARDSAVPPVRQFAFQGPASADQTKTAKVK